MAETKTMHFPGSGLWPGAQFRRHRAGRRGSWPQSGVPVNPGFVDVYKGYGFEAHPVDLAPMPPEQMAKFWEDFINGHIPNFRKSPYDQVDSYVEGATVDGDRR